ncbi:hypothetical protein [Paenibacillus methanolicus]|uniref:Uncharacterized protein n=1 Tax=Paenibacillus methanolicus TaxID=582686 RepID=A0A5S5BRC3_9BACL|nr:hypothetical protein [Paenibacillus methanolicus]TYP69755.1 hypothetical protein BCM02_11386 [Paenibacillus methanolicus]
MPETMMRDGLALLIATMTLFASYGAGSIALGGSTGRMRRTARLTLLLLAGAALLIGGEAAAVARTEAGPATGQWIAFAVLLALPALTAVSAAAHMAKLTIKLEPVIAARPSRTLRRAASDKKIVLPVHALTLGSVVYAAATVFPSVRETAWQLALFAGAAVTLAVLLAVRQHVKHKRIHRLDGTAAVYRLKRLMVLGTAAVLLPVCLIHAATPGRTTVPAIIEADADDPATKEAVPSVSPGAKTMGWFPPGADETGTVPVSSILQ